MSRKIKLTQTKTFTKTATIEIECPDDLELQNVDNWLYENQDLWWQSLDWSTTSAELDYDPEFDNSRYDVVETTEKHLYGGTL